MDTSNHSALWLCLIVIFFGFLSLDAEFMQHGFYRTINTAFDFDQAWFVDVIARSPQAWQHRELVGAAPALLVKHPFMYSYLVFTIPLTYIGLSAEFAAIFVSLSFAIASVWLLYQLALTVFDNGMSAMLLALLYVLSASFVAIATTIDSYTIVVFWMALALLIYQQQSTGALASATCLKVLCYVMLVGTTSYFMLFVILLESAHLVRAYAKQNFSQQLAQSTKTLLYCGALSLVIFVIIYWPILGELIEDPMSVIKRAFWAVARQGEKEGAWQVLQTLVMYSLYAPAGTLVSIESGQTMLDLRAANYGLFDGLIVLVLATLMALGVRQCRHSALLVVACIWLFFTLVFHLFYQDRGSLFLYTPHVILCVFVVLMYGLKYLNAMPRNTLLLGLLVAFSLNSFAFYQEIQAVAQVAQHEERGGTHNAAQ